MEGFPQPPGLPKDTKAYLHFVDEIYQSDAYHSLSIEGYRVTPELIERVFERRGQDRLQRAATRLDRLSFPDQVRELTRILDEDGYVAECQTAHDGSRILAGIALTD